MQIRYWLYFLDTTHGRLPDAGTTYENVFNVIAYSSNKYFASCWYVL